MWRRLIILLFILGMALAFGVVVYLIDLNILMGGCNAYGPPAFELWLNHSWRIEINQCLDYVPYDPEPFYNPYLQDA